MPSLNIEVSNRFKDHNKNMEKVNKLVWKTQEKAYGMKYKEFKDMTLRERTAAKIKYQTEQDRKRKMLKKIAERIPMIKQIVEKYKDISKESTIEYGNLLMGLMEDLPITAPRLVKRTDSESKMKNYVDCLQIV